MQILSQQKVLSHTAAGLFRCQPEQGSALLYGKTWCSRCAAASVCASLPKAPITCNPTGSPLGAAATGMLTHGTRSSVQMRLKSGSPVMASPAGAAPEGLDTTGDPLFSRIWTLLRVPCVSIPVAVAANGLPIGLQVVGAFGSDAQTLAAAHRLHQVLR